MTTATLNHHGDVTFDLINELPINAVFEPRIQKDRVMLAPRSSQTGHEHKITAPASSADVYTIGDKRYLSVSKPVSIEGHPDHGTTPVEPGVYELGRFREWDPVEGARIVED